MAWLLDQNPEYRDRIVRKGDLRASILETLRRDLPGRAPSEVALARLSGATRAAARKALAALHLEGAVTLGADAPNERDHPVALREGGVNPGTDVECSTFLTCDGEIWRDGIGVTACQLNSSSMESAPGGRKRGFCRP